MPLAREIVGSKMYWKRSPQEIEDELLKLHAAGEIKLDLSRAGTGNPEDLLAGDVDGVICDALFRVQGFEGAGRQRTCPMCHQRFWGPWIADVVCSDECQEERNRQNEELMRRVRSRYESEG